MSRYGSGRKFAYAVAESLQVDPALFVDAMMKAFMPLTAFDRLNEDNAQVEHVARSVGSKCLGGLYIIQSETGDTPELIDSIAKLEARKFKAEKPQ